jgi:hypothetical protein
VCTAVLVLAFERSFTLGLIMEGPSLLHLLGDPGVESFLASRKWRNQTDLKNVLRAGVNKFTAIDHNGSKTCNVHKASFYFIARAKTKEFIKRNFEYFLTASQEWLASTLIAPGCCQVQVGHYFSVTTLNLMSYLQAGEGGEQHGGGGGLVHQAPDLEPEVRWLLLIHHLILFDAQMLAGEEQEEQQDGYDQKDEAPKDKKRRKSYDESARSTQYSMVSTEVKRISGDPGLENQLFKVLDKRGKKRNREGTSRDGDEGLFDEKLSCLNAINICNLSMNGWDVLRLWARDYVARGGDLTKLPGSKVLNSYKMALVPSGLECTDTSASLPLQEVLNHTMKRLADRPDMQEKFDAMDDGAIVDSFIKWGEDGQTGLAAYARSKEHDDRSCINEGVSLIMVSFLHFANRYLKCILFRSGTRTRRSSTTTRSPAGSTCSDRCGRAPARRVKTPS